MHGQQPMQGQMPVNYQVGPSSQQFNTNVQYPPNHVQPEYNPHAPQMGGNVPQYSQILPQVVPVQPMNQPEAPVIGDIAPINDTHQPQEFVQDIEGGEGQNDLIGQGGTDEGYVTHR